MNICRLIYINRIGTEKIIGSRTFVRDDQELGVWSLEADKIQFSKFQLNRYKRYTNEIPLKGAFINAPYTL